MHSSFISKSLTTERACYKAIHELEIQNMETLIDGRSEVLQVSILMQISIEREGQESTFNIITHF